MATAENDVAVEAQQTAEPVSRVLSAFSAGNEVPGSGSANALCAALAASLTASVALKTLQHSGEYRYINVKQTAVDIERQSRSLGRKLEELVARDSEVFAPVIAIRRETGSIADPLRHDQAMRREVAALKPATEIPLQTAAIALEVAELALKMADIGFQGARGEAYTAATQAIASIDGSLYVAELNLKTIRLRVKKLHDWKLERTWLKVAMAKIAAIRQSLDDVRMRVSRVLEALHSDAAVVKKKRSRKTKPLTS